MILIEYPGTQDDLMKARDERVALMNEVCVPSLPPNFSSF
jgi:hypothetical protein